MVQFGWISYALHVIEKISADEETSGKVTSGQASGLTLLVDNI